MLRNIAKMGISNLLAQMLPFLFLPITTRIYNPENFGPLALFVAITAMTSIVATFRYELSLVACNKIQFKYLNTLVFLLILLLFTLVYIIVLMLTFFDIHFLKIENLFLIPIAVLSTAFSSNLTYIATRFNKFDAISLATIIKSLVFLILHLTLHYWFSYDFSLIYSWVISSLSYMLTIYLNLDAEHVTIIYNPKRIKAVALRFKTFPKYSLPASLISTQNSQANNFITPIYYGATIAGAYSLIERFLASPISILGNAVGQVFYSTISNKNNYYIYRCFLHYSITLFGCSLVLAAAIYLFGKYIFLIFFGDKWLSAIPILYMFMPLFLTQLCVSPLFYILHRFKLNKVELTFQVSVFIYYVFIYGICIFFDFDYSETFTFISIGVSGLYWLVYLYMFRYLSKIRYCK